MQEIPGEQVRLRLERENPWWRPPHLVPEPYAGWRPRRYLDLFLPLVRRSELRRAVVLLGPRRVGKTVLLHHAIAGLLESGVPASHICYLSVDHPIYNGLRLEQLLEHYAAATGVDPASDPCFFFFDEVQYLRGWETHLKALVDQHARSRFIASGSAAAALRLKSTESGAGRFTDFLLPPLTFVEYLDLLHCADLVAFDADGRYTIADPVALNEEFVHYLNFGGYPELVLSAEARSDPGRFIKSDIVDKVLLRDLPSLYGVQDIQELNYLFTTLAFNTGNEVSPEGLSQRSGVAKNTIKRYIEYLEAAFLIRAIHRVDRSARRFVRANYFKIYLTNPSIRSALFSPIAQDDASGALGALVETAVFAQWFHSDTSLHYARWGGGGRNEVDIVGLAPDQAPRWAVEVKWSDRCVTDIRDVSALRSLVRANRKHLSWALVTTKTVSQRQSLEGVDIVFMPAAVYAYWVGEAIIRGKTNIMDSLRHGLIANLG